MVKLSQSQGKKLNNRRQQVTHKLYSISASGYLDKGETIILKLYSEILPVGFKSKLTYILSYYFVIGIKSFHLEIKITIFLKKHVDSITFLSICGICQRWSIKASTYKSKPTFSW